MAKEAKRKWISRNWNKKRTECAFEKASENQEYIWDARLQTKLNHCQHLLLTHTLRRHHTIKYPEMRSYTCYAFSHLRNVIWGVWRSKMRCQHSLVRKTWLLKGYLIDRQKQLMWRPWTTESYPLLLQWHDVDLLIWRKKVFCFAVFSA